jgi:hypothetical protein
MYYLFPILFCIYYFRYNLAEFTLRTISRIEISYEKWLNVKYPPPSYTIYLNGKLINTNDDITILNNRSSNQNIFEIEYLYNSKKYSIYGIELKNLLEYVKNIDVIIEKEMVKKTPIYKWISAEDDHNICVLNTIKKASGPLGDFYKHYNIDINSDYISDIIGKKIILTNYNLDEYFIKPSSVINLCN